MKNTQYIFFDIDGTLIGDGDKGLSEGTKEALLHARQNGHKIFINSGRTYCSLPPFLLEGFDGYLCGCGTNLYLDGKELFCVVIPAERVQEIIRTAEKYKVHVVFEGRDAIYFSEKSLDYPLAKRWYADYIEQETNAVLYCLGDDIVCSKFCVGVEENSNTKEFLEAIENDFDIIDRGGDFYEVLPKGYSKSTAMAETLLFYGGARKDTWAFGDSNNDLPMLRFAEHPVVMGEHSAGLEKYAEFVADTVQNNGIYKIMKQQGII